jgi:hypothetical protein
MKTFESRRYCRRAINLSTYAVFNAVEGPQLRQFEVSPSPTADAVTSNLVNLDFIHTPYTSPHQSTLHPPKPNPPPEPQTRRRDRARQADFPEIRTLIGPP